MSPPILRPTQANIARLSGVSRPTVSLVLSGDPGPSKETQRKVLAVAQELGYRPNLLVRGIKSGHSQSIGVAIPPVDSYWAEILYGVHDELVGAEYSPLLMWAHHSEVKAPRFRGTHTPDNAPTDGLKVIFHLLDRRVDAVILWPPFAFTYEQHIHEFLNRKVPVVTIDHDLPRAFGTDSVSANDRAGGRLAAQHLLGLGHRQLAHVTGYLKDSWARDRRDGFESEIAKTSGASCTVVETPDDDSVFDLTLELLSRRKRPTAIFAGTDKMAAAIYKAAARLKLKIPDDLSVVGFADLSFSATLSPALTTIRPDAYKIGRIAAAQAVARAQGNIDSQKAQKIKVPVDFIERDSTCQLKR
jgi:LacI family transcriptional regulator